MIYARIISVENPQPGPSGTTCESYRHSKFVYRRKYVEQTLLPQMKRLGFASSELFKAVTDADCDPIITRGPAGEPKSIVWMGKTVPIVSDSTPCFLSQFELWHLCIEKNVTLLALEDDAKLSPEYEGYLAAALQEYDYGPYDTDVLYLQLALPYHPTSLHSFDPRHCTKLSDKLTRVNRTHDMAGTAAYAIKPEGARRMIAWGMEHGTRGTDGSLHRAFDAGKIGYLILTDFSKSFMLNDHYAEWNHAHSCTAQ